MKNRNKKVATTIGVKSLAGVLAFGLAFSAPCSVLAEEPAAVVGASTEASAETMQPQDDNTQKILAKTVDGTETLVEVADFVLEMVRRGEVKLDEQTQYLIDTSTKQKVNPVTGERVNENTETPDTPDTPDMPETPDTPENPDTPEAPETPDTPETPETPETPDTPETPGTSETPADTPTVPDQGTQTNPTDGSTKTPEQSVESPAAGKTEENVVSNSALIANQQIVKLPEIVEDFRFWTVARKYAFAKSKLYIREEIPAGEKESEQTAQEKIADLKAAKEDADFLKESYEKKEKNNESLKKIQDTKPIVTKSAFSSKLQDQKKEKIGNTVKTIQKTKMSSLFSGFKKKDTLRQLKQIVEQKETQEKEKLDTELASQQLQEGVRSVGEIPKDGLLYILKEEDNGWLYVESGNVRGFVKASEVFTGDAAQALLTVYQTQAKKIAEGSGKEYTGIEGTARTAEAKMPVSENKAYTYLRATVNQTVAEKQYALVTVNKLNVREEKNKESQIVGTMKQGDLCYILADRDSDWIYIESGDVRGFVSKEGISFGDAVTQQVDAHGEDTYSTAEKSIDPSENQALYYTLTSVKAGTPDGEIRQSMIEFASQFIGNPYVWGGTSLTDGADCSGFVQQIYKQYGYDLPRVAADQSQYGTKIAVEDAQPGDLIFYAKNGHVYHVVMYAGDGKTIEAANSKVGIIQGTVNKADAVWATRILKENYTLAGGGIGEVNATADMYGTCLGNFKITYYCACEICCDVETGITATGAPVVEGETIAVDPRVIPYGTKVIIGGHVFTAEDCGGAIKQNHIDVYVNNHAEAQALGVNYADVYLVK